ncbi:MAG: FtsX-like permease family protein [Treponema sp.]|nr:FtsX-like permease family protein [Treponema sp.]
MEKIFILFKLGLKYLYRYRRRYSFLLAALIFCFAVVTFITSTKDSMYDNVYYSAQSHYAGDVIAVGYNAEVISSHRYNMSSEEISIILEAANDSNLNPKHITFRTMFYNTGIVFFNGNYVVQRYVIGCDWDNEEYLFSKMDFVSPISHPIGDDGIILSAPVANELGARVGDSIILEIENILDQKNTGQFIVKGIVQDTTLFGYYKVYISRLSLNRLLLFNDDDCSIIGFFLNNRSAAEKNRVRLNEVLSDRIQTGPLVYNREDMMYERNTPWSGTRVFLYTLPVYLSEVSDLMEAMNIITYFLYGIMLIIIFVSAAVTYRLILHERTKEMGVMRSIGFFGGDLRIVLWTEVTILGIISFFGGFLISTIFSAIASNFSFSWFPSFEIFLKDGRLSALYLPNTIIINIVLTLLILASAVIYPSLRASTKRLPSLLAGEPL